jgi:hypothetical protein
MLVHISCLAVTLLIVNKNLMKKIGKSLSKNYLPVKLYLNDLFNIEDILKMYSNSIEIEAEGYQYSSIKELSEQLNINQITELKIIMSQPYTEINFYQQWAYIFVVADDIRGARLFIKLDELLKNKRRPLCFFYNYFFINFIWTFIFSLNFFVDKYRIPYILLCVLGGFWIIWAIFVRMRRHSLIIIAKDNGFVKFWMRKKDDIIINIMTALIAAALGVFGTLLVQHFTK